MNNNNKKVLEKGYGLVVLPENIDERGSLTFSEWHHLPFEPKRVFWIYNVQDGKTRGGHAHSECAEVVFAIKGGFDMWIDNGTEQTTLHISKANEGIYIGKNVWCELRNFLPGTVCVALASLPYNAKGYINDYDDFKKIYNR